MSDQSMLKWLGGFFDGEGSCSFSQASPSIQIVNTNPKASMLCMSLLRNNGIEAKISERSQPSKSSKKKRWDVYVHQADEAIKAANFLIPYVWGKRKQLELIIEYSKNRKNTYIYHKEMQFLNQTSNILVINDEILWQKIGYKMDQKKHENPNDQNVRIDLISDYNDMDYLAGLLDADGTVGMGQRENKGKYTDRFTPHMAVINTNKEIVNRAYSTIRNNEIGCFVSTRIPTTRNRIRWDLLVSGVKRVKRLAYFIKDRLQIKRQQAELLYLYCCEREKAPKSPVNDTGYQCKMAIEALNKE